LGRVRQLAVAAPDEADRPARDTLARLERPDLVVIEGVGVMEAAEDCRAIWPDVPMVIDFHNVESDLLRQADMARLPAALRPLSGLVYGRRWAAAGRRDRHALAIADRIWTCTDEDRRLAMSLAEGQGRGPTSVTVIPNPIPDWCLSQEAPPDRPFVAPELLFVGHLGYAPNKRAARRLAREVLPQLRRLCPDARLTIAGRGPNARLRRDLAACPNMTLVADPPDLSDIYRRADLVVIPLGEGGGSRIKVLEALALGCPVVASAKAVEGLGLRPGQHFLQADTATEAAEATRRLGQDAALRARLIAEGRALVLARHGRDSLSAAVAADVADLLRSEATR
jgi:glycosyltransferase involved in cell wall biosynthesis